MYVPRSDVIFLDMAVEDGLKLVISGGLVAPPDRKTSKPAEAIPNKGTPPVEEKKTA
jgi:uncharacterized membrane protein